MLFGLGFVTYSSLYNYLLSHFHISTALRITAILLTFPTMLTSFFISYSPHQRDVPLQFRERESFQGLIKKMSVWLYFSSVFGTRAAYAFIPFFTQFAKGYGVEELHANKALETLFFLSSMSRPFVGMLGDRFKFGKGPFDLASKNLMCLILFVQTGIFITLHSLSGHTNYVWFQLAAGGLLCAFSGASSIILLLAKDVFGSRNSFFVYSLAGSLSMGLGEFVSVQACSEILTHHNERVFFWIGACWSGIALATCVGLAPCYSDLVQRNSRPCFNFVQTCNNSNSELNQKQLVTIYDTV